MVKLKRQTHKPIGFTGQEMEGFFMAPKEYAAIAITNRLTGTQLRLWLYLIMIDPFADNTPDGDRIYHDIPSPAEIALKIGASPRTVEKDMRRLQKLGLYDFRIKEWQGYNLTYQEAKRVSEEMKQAKADLKRLKSFPDKGGYLAVNSAILPEPVLNNRSCGYLTEVEIAKSLPEELSSDLSVGSDLQTYSDSNQTLKERENNEQKNQMGSNQEKKGLNASASLKIQSASPRKKKIISEWDQFSAPGRDPEFFEFVVRKTAKWPQTPADAKCAAESWIRKQGHILYPEYLEWQKGQKRAAERIHEAIPVETVPVQMVESEPMAPQKWLERYQGMWEADERSRQYLRKAIAQHPERGVCLGENGPELVVEDGRSLQRSDFPLDLQSSVLEPTLEPSTVTPEDFSDVLAGIDVEISRLGWSASQLSAHLGQMYAKQSRQQLTDQELLNLLFCLQDWERLAS
jgi:biotin operon repressor